MLFFVEKKYGRIKGRGCAIGNTQLSCTPKEEAISSKVATDSVLITRVIDTKQEHDVVSLEIPNVFVQALVPPSNVKIITKIRGRTADLLLETNYENNAPFVCDAKNGKMLHVRIVKMLCGTLKSILLCYGMFMNER